MKKVVIALFITFVVAFGAVKGGLHYTTQKFVDNQVIQAKPFVDITYKDISTSLSGSATVSDVKFFIPMLDETIYIKSIQFMANDLKSLLTLNDQLNNRQLPDSLSLLFNGASINLNGNIMKLMDNPEVEPTHMEIFSTLACGDVRRIGSQALSDMGYEDITSDIILRYQFNARDKQFKYSFSNNIRDMFHMTLAGEINNVSNLDSFANQSAKPGKVSLEIKDDSYIERKNRFCAKQSKQSVEEYIKEHTSKVETYLDSYGVRPEQGLLDAYKTVITTSGTTLFEANLGDLTGFEEFKTFTPNDVIQFMRLKLFVNGQRINEISIDIDKDKLVETATDDVKPVTPDEIERKKSIRIKKYRTVATAELKNFTGYRAKVETTKGKHYKGTIGTQTNQSLEIISRLRSGNISYHVPWGQIKQVEVLH